MHKCSRCLQISYTLSEVAEQLNLTKAQVRARAISRKLIKEDQRLVLLNKRDIELLQRPVKIGRPTKK